MKKSESKNLFDLNDINEYAKEIRENKRIESPSKGMGDIPQTSIPAWMSQYVGYTIQHFPIHLFPPRGSKTFDIRESFNLSSPTVGVRLIDFTIPNNMIAFWRAYTTFSDVPKGVISKFDIRVNGVPALTYHGSSLNNFEKTLSLGNDLEGEIDALVELKGLDRITIDATVTSSVIPVTLAARIKGWMLPAGTIKIEQLGS